MQPIEMAIFIAMVTLPVLGLVAIAWMIRWRRDPDRFKRSWRTISSWSNRPR